MAGVQREAGQDVPVQVCDALKNSADRRGPHTPNKHLQLGMEQQDENVSLVSRERIFFL